MSSRQLSLLLAVLAFVVMPAVSASDDGAAVALYTDEDPAAMAYFREQIAQVAAVPVLDLREPAGEEAVAPAPAGRAARRAGKAAGEQAPEKGARRGLRVPWQRRPRRAAPPAVDPEPLSATG